MKPIVALVIGSLALFAVVAEAQERPGAPRVAVLDWESSSTDRLEPFRQGLRDLGYVEGRNIVVDYRYAEQNVDRADALAAEIMQRPVTVIVAFATPAAHAAKKVSSTIPIVFASADPVGTGLVSNLARPGGNLTGVSNMMPDLESKRLELLHEILRSSAPRAILPPGISFGRHKWQRSASASDFSPCWSGLPKRSTAPSPALLERTLEP